MRYMARRVRTGQWLTRDLEITAERVRELSGPGSIVFTVDPEMKSSVAADGLKVLEDWGTFIYAVDESLGSIRQVCLVVPPDTHDETSMQITCAGVSTFPHGYVHYDGVPAVHNGEPPAEPLIGDLWDVGGVTRRWNGSSWVEVDPTSADAALIQVDPIKMFIRHWDWIQQQAFSDLGVQITGHLGQDFVRVGDNEEPYALPWYEFPDIGEELDRLASSTPFDYVEDHAWASETQDTPVHRIRIGYPRLGRERTDLRFAIGENIVETVTGETRDDFTNFVIGIGNGEASTMVWSAAAIDDGRLRRPKIVTDKTLKRQADVDKLVRDTMIRFSPGLDFETHVIKEHRNAPIESINLGDDIRVQAWLPTYGEINMKVRVLSIGEVDTAPGLAVLGVQRSSDFTYNPNVEIEGS